MSVSRKSLISGLIFAGITLLLCAIAAGAAAMFFDIPDAVLDAAAVIIIGAAAYFAAYRSTQINRSKGIKQGFLCGVSLFLLLFILSLMFSVCHFSELMAVKAAVCLIFGIVGGVIGINTKKTKR